MKFDLGINKNVEYEDDDYTVKYLSDLKVGDTLTGDIHISELKEGEYQGNLVHQFYIIITNHHEKLKWVLGISTSTYTQDNNEVTIYGKQGGRVYTLIDSLNHALNNTTLNKNKSYTVVFETFQKNMNKNVAEVTVQLVQSMNINARTPNISITKASLVEEDE